MSSFIMSDPHFGHLNMALKRGFKTVEDHDEHIVKMWNSVVKKKDTVYILGDITMEKSVYYPILQRLLGYKKVILGNHDRPQHVPELLKYVNSVQSMKYMGDKGVGGIILTHAPIHPCELDYRFKFNIHGHVHENTLDDPRYINVSAEVINYTPIDLEKLIENLKLK